MYRELEHVACADCPRQGTCSGEWADECGVLDEVA